MNKGLRMTNMDENNPDNLAETPLYAEDTVAQTDEAIEARVDDLVERMLNGAHVRRSLASQSRKKGIDFWQVYGMIIALILMGIGGGLGYLWQNLQLYEASLPERTLEQYWLPLIQGGLPKLMIYEGAKPAKYESSQERDRYIRDYLKTGELTFARAVAESNGESEVYLFKAGGTTLAAVTLEKKDIGRFGRWEAVKEETRMPIYGDLRIVAPQHTAVYANGIGLYSEDKVAEGLPYQELAGLPQDIIEIPLQDAYLITGLYREPEITATGVAGNPLEVIWQEDEEGPFVRAIPNAPEEDIATFEKMALADARVYSNYLSNDVEFVALGRRMVRGTEIYRNMQVMETVFYTDHVANSFSNERVHNIRLYYTDCLIMDIDYVYTITRANGMTYPFDTVVTFAYFKIDDQWLISDITLQQE